MTEYSTMAELEQHGQEPDLSATRHEGHEPIPPDDRVSGVRLLVRLYTSKHVHRLMPAPVALAIASVFGTPGRRHQKADELRRSECLMKDLLLYTPRAGEARALARRNVAEMSRLRELFWRPWLLKHSRVTGQEHWEAARAGGRGCVVVVSHLGAVYAVSRILRQKGLHHYAVATPRYWEAQAPGYIGLETRYLHTEYAEAVGAGRLISSIAPPGQLIALLEGGESVLIAFDVPGSAATPFLGRSVALSGGPATLAFRTGAKVLPVIPERHGTRIDLRMFKPLDPEDYRDLPSLRARIARVFEQLVLAKPEIVPFSWFPQPLVTEALSSRAEDSALDAS